MANGISALNTRRRERPISNPSWRTVATFGATSRGRTADKEFHNAADGSPPNVVRLDRSPTVVGGGIKRWFDVAGALSAILLLLPLFCLIALAIKLWDRGPIFYRHRRVGLNGSSFDCLKFRSMVVDADKVLARHLAANSESAREWEETRKLKRDPRITPLGASMRKTSIDELPQLLNILKGEMSFVGPRPIVTAEVPKYGPVIVHYLRTRPGLTGPWQISGRNDVDYSTRVALDQGYVENWNFWRDIAIIAKTARVVVTARGCY
jgi:exopolysaccharide production protein ExoY